MEGLVRITSLFFRKTDLQIFKNLQHFDRKNSACLQLITLVQSFWFISSLKMEFHEFSQRRLQKTEEKVVESFSVE